MSQKLNPDEISSVLKQQFANFTSKVETYEAGTVLNVGDGIARVFGLANVMAGELVEFPGGIKGMALNLEESNVGVAIFGSDAHIKEGDEVKRTGKIASVPAGEGSFRPYCGCFRRSYRRETRFYFECHAAH